MNDQELGALLGRVSRSSNRLRVAMGITAALCALIVVGVLADGSVWAGGWGWWFGGSVGVVFFAAVTVMLVYGAFWRQRRHIARLRRVLRDDPQAIRSIRLLVARAVPVTSWSPDDGSAQLGLHVVVEDEAGRNWMLPVARADAAAVVDGLSRRCPKAATGPA